MSIEVKVTLDSLGNAFIRATDAAFIVNRFPEELNSWVKPNKFKHAKLTAYKNERKNGVWFSLLDCLAYANEHGMLDDAGNSFVPINGSWSSPALTRSKLTFIDAVSKED